MFIVKLLFCGLAAAAVCAGQSVTISGRVTDTAGAPISGAMVALEKGGQNATTGPDGVFSLKGAAGIIDHGLHSQPHPLSAKIRNGVLYLNVARQSPVTISAFNLQGQVVFTAQRTLTSGTHAVALRQRGAGVYYYKVQSGANEILIKSHSIGGGAAAANGSSSDEAFVIAKQARTAGAIDDVIAVTKSGFLNYRVIVTNSDTNGIEIEMVASAGTVTDIDGNVYQTVKIGTQTWMAENLRTTKYNDGTAIPHVPLIANWTNLATPAYVAYGNMTDADSLKRFGLLYNWYVVNTKKLAPAGWHVPSDADWDKLKYFLIAQGYNWNRSKDTSENKIGKALAAKADWITNEVEGAVGCDLSKNNVSGFAALPGGSRYYDVNFNYLGQIGYWWTSTAIDNEHSDYRMLNTFLDFFDSYLSLNSCGCSVRLVKD